MATKKAVKKVAKKAVKKAVKKTTAVKKAVVVAKKDLAKKKVVAKAATKKLQVATKNYRYRSAGDGEIISKVEAEKRDPNTVVRETIKPKAKTIAVTPAVNRKSVLKTAVRAIAQSIDSGTASRAEILAAAGKKITTKYKS